LLDVVFRQLMKVEVPHQLLRLGGAALSARAATGIGLESFPVDAMAEPWWAAVAWTAPGEDVAGVRTAVFKVTEGLASRSTKVPA
jgi:hypothetical protein